MCVSWNNITSLVSLHVLLLSKCTPESVHHYVYLCVCLSVCLSIYLSIDVCVCLRERGGERKSWNDITSVVSYARVNFKQLLTRIYLSVCVYLSIYLSIYLCGGGGGIYKHV